MSPCAQVNARIQSTQDKLLERIEYTKASIRAKVEHPFHVVKNLFRHRKARYKEFAKNTAKLFSLSDLQI